MSDNSKIVPISEPKTSSITSMFDPLFFLQAGGILAEACYEMFIKDKDPEGRSNKFRTVANVINAGVLGYRVYSKLEDMYSERKEALSREPSEEWTEIVFRHDDPMYKLTKTWVSKQTSFVDPTARLLAVDLKQFVPKSSSGIQVVRAVASEDDEDVCVPCQVGSMDASILSEEAFEKITLDTCVIPSGEVCFEWNGYDLEFKIITSVGSKAKIEQTDEEKKDNILEDKKFFKPMPLNASIAINTRDKDVVDELFAAIKKEAYVEIQIKEPEPIVPAVFNYHNLYNEWNWVMNVPERSAILPETYDTSLVDDVKQFFTNKDWYRSVGVPHRRGYMFYGLPGTGKTSTVITIARRAELDVYIINLNKLTDSKSFERAITSAYGEGKSKGSILLFEDIDCVLDQRKISTSMGNKRTIDNPEMIELAEPQLSFSEFLNVIDGIASREDQIIIMTTNKGLDDFDSALMRPGRIDVKVHFTYATEYQIRKLIERFVPDNAELCDKMYHEIASRGPCTMCEVQEYLITWHFGKTKSL